MSTHRYPGGVISATPPTASASTAVGVWTLEEALRNKAAGNWPDGSGADPYFDQTTLLLHGDGTNGAQNNTFLDSSTNNFTITRNGNTTQGSFGPYAGPGCWSNYFDGTGDYLNIATSTAFGIGTGDFTIEYWVYFNSLSGTPTVFDMRSSGADTMLSDYYNGSGNPVLYYNSANLLVSSGVVTVGSWNHIVWVRSGTTITSYVNGVARGTATSSANFGTTQPFRIGANITPGAYVNGYISNFRFVKGAAVYTSAFTPSTTPLVATTQTVLLTCNNNGFIDQSAANNTLTRNGDTQVSKFSPFTLYQITPASYSGYFDGTGDYLTAPASNSTIWPGSGSFTIEYWLYLPANPSTGYYTHFSYGTSGSVLRVFNAAATSKIEVFSGTSTILNPAWPTAGQWNHFALVRNGTTLTLYINGAVAQSVTNSTDFSTGTLTIGGESASNPLLGSISNFRIVKGTAVYTSAFTPPTSPLTAISGTSLLTCQSTTFIDNSTNAFTITANGNARPRDANPFTDTVTGPTPYSTTTYGGSAYFDGTGDYLTVPDSALLEPGSNNFTVECWFYMTGANPTNGAVLFSKANTSSYSPITVGFTTTGAGSGITALSSATGSTWGINLLGTATATTLRNSWNHVAYVRNGNVFTLYLNGAVAATTTNAIGALVNNTELVRFGQTNFTATDFPGFISNLRYVVGTAVYTGPFVPPTSPVTAVTNTQLLLNATNAGIFDNTTVNDIETVGAAQISTSVVKYGTGSMSFNGTTSYLTSPNNNALDFGSGDFTLEGWVYLSANQSSKIIVSIGTLDGATRSVGFWIGGTQKLEGYFSADGSTWLSYKIGTTTVVSGQWNHVAFVRSGTTFYLFLNGVSEGAQTGTPTTASSGKALLVGGQSGNYFLNGYIDDLRITKGYARYTANFTPPASAFPNT